MITNKGHQEVLGDSGFIPFMIFVAAVLLFYQFGMRYVLIYEFTETKVQAVLLWSLPVSSTRYELIKELRIISSLEALFQPAMRTENRLTGPHVLIYRRIFPMLMTPDDPEEFVRQLRRRVYEETGRLV